MVQFLEECTENCGWVAAVAAVITWGSFGVPLKTAAKVEVNFFVMQTYKTVICFLTCWFVLLLGVDLRWSNWGLASGLFWVPGAAAGIYGISNAGLAVAQGTWSAIQVLVSFVFGIIIFQEGVKSIYRTVCAFLLLAVGLVGMSRYAEAGAAHAATRKTNVSSAQEETSSSSDAQVFTYKPVPNSTGDKESQENRKAKRYHKLPVFSGQPVATTPSKPLEIEALLEDEMVVLKGVNANCDEEIRNRKDKFHIMVPTFGLAKPMLITLTRRQMGILGAVANGAWGGCNMIPLHYAIRDDGLSGADYLISFATGSLIVNVVLWLGLFGYHLHHRRGDLREALEALPKFHLRELGMPGLLAGLLYSLGNFSSIIAVAYLGQATGFSFCQMQLFVSGLWGVFCFGEIRGFEIVTKWFFAAMIAVAGIIWLSYEHEGQAMGHR